ncbi:MAG: hypothetical protein ACYC6F_06610 [Longimicrobiales bacterium]
MKRYTMAIALGILLADFASAEGQTAARVEYRNGQLGVAVAIGNLPYRVYAPRVRGSLNRGELNRILGNRTVNDIARNGRAMGARGAMRGQWYGAGRGSAVLEVTLGGFPVAEAWDYGGDGYVDRVVFAEASRRWRPR